MTHSVPAISVVFTDFDEFVKSKPRPRPLETDQYVWHEDAARTRPKMISCKMKTTDHIIAEYGPGASGGNVSCAAVNQRTVELVLGSLTRAERKRLMLRQTHFEQIYQRALVALQNAGAAFDAAQDTGITSFCITTKRAFQQRFR